jgi:hypothetical protein
MMPPTDNLNDLESDINHLAHLMDVIADILVELPREENSGRTMLDKATALSWIARDMSLQLTEAVAMCHSRVIADLQGKKGGSLQ